MTTKRVKLTKGQRGDPLRGALEGLGKSIDRVVEERDALLKALRMVNDSGVPLADSIEEAMLAAIAKAEGRS